MATTRQRWFAGIMAPLVLGGAFVLRAAGHGGAAFMLEAGQSAITLRSNLDDIARGSYIESQAVDLFCSATASINLTGSLPEEATDWQAFVKGRVGVTSADQYFEGKAEQLETAIDAAQMNPRAAAKYVQACLLR